MDLLFFILYNHLLKQSRIDENVAKNITRHFASYILLFVIEPIISCFGLIIIIFTGHFLQVRQSYIIYPLMFIYIVFANLIILKYISKDRAEEIYKKYNIKKYSSRKMITIIALTWIIGIILIFILYYIKQRVNPNRTDF